MNSTLPLITIVTFLPLVGVLILLFQRKDDADLLKRTALTVAAVVFVVSLLFVVQIGSIGGFDLNITRNTPGFRPSTSIMKSASTA